MPKSLSKSNNKESQDEPPRKKPALAVRIKTSKSSRQAEQRLDKAIRRVCDKATKEATFLPDITPTRVGPPSIALSDKSLHTGPITIDTGALWECSTVNPTVMPLAPQSPGPPSRPTPPPTEHQGAPPPPLIVNSELQELLTKFLKQSMRPASEGSVVSEPGAASDLLDEQSLSGQGPLRSQEDLDSLRDLGDLEEGELSEDEGCPPEPPASSGLFPPSMFRSLLYKAIATTGCTLPGDKKDADTSASLKSSLFSIQPPTADVIPSPSIFVDSVKSSWTHVANPPPPSQLDKKFYNVATDFATLLQVPSIDEPVAALWSRSNVPGDPEEGLRPEDKRMEHFFQRAHQGSDWAIRSSMTASFFGRAAIMWLKELQEKVQTGDHKIHQDINKVVAAVQFMADATLQSMKFSAKGLASTVGARRMMWLRPWQVDARRKYRLASASYSGSSLFGDALSPLLIENKEKKKVLPTTSSSNRKTDSRPNNFNSRRFQARDGSNTSRGQGSFYPRYRPYSTVPSASYDRPFSYDKFSRGRGATNKRPFRGGGSRSFRRQR